MRSIALLLGLGFAVPAVAQQVWVYGPSNTAAPVAAPATTTQGAGSIRPGPTYHQIGSSTSSSSSTVSNSNAAKLVDLMGVQKRFDADRNRSMLEAKRELLHDHPILTPAFVNEWAKRVEEQMNSDDYGAIAAKVYAAHFSDAELAELVKGQTNVNAGKQSGLSVPLRQKLERELPTMAGEIAGGFAQAGATLGAEVAEQVAKEHPDWLRRPAASGGSK